MLKQSIMCALVASGPILGIAGTAQAQTLNDALVNGPPVTTSALLLAGGPFSNPSVFGLRANANECVRVEATSASFDPKFTIVAPDGQVFRDNNGGIGTLPLVKIASARDNGVYTLVISSATGAAIATGTVTFTYGRYSAGNANCSAPTAPL